MLRGLGNGAFTAQRSLSLPQGSLPSAVALADLNRDGALDLIIAHANGIAVFPGDGAGDFDDRLDAAAGLSPLGLAVGDVNRDGRLDLAFTSATRRLRAGHAGDRRRDLRRSRRVLRLHRAQRAGPGRPHPRRRARPRGAGRRSRDAGRPSGPRQRQLRRSDHRAGRPRSGRLRHRGRQQGRSARPGRALVRSPAAPAAQRRQRRRDHRVRRLPAAEPGGVQRRQSSASS